MRAISQTTIRMKQVHVRQLPAEVYTSIRKEQSYHSLGRARSHHLWQENIRFTLSKAEENESTKVERAYLWVV